MISFDKEALKQISSVANHPTLSNEANWKMVSIIFKHTNSSKRIASGFKNNFTKTDNVKLKANMSNGEVYELHEIIISGTNRQPRLSIKRSEITNASSMDLTLGGGNVAPDPVTLALSTTSNSVLQAFSVTATFSESVTGFALSDISVTNGTASNLTGSGANYSFTITPTSDGQIAVSVPQGSATASSSVSNNASNSLSITYYAPASLTLSTVSNQVNAAFNVTAAFSKSVTGFALSDIFLTNGTASNLSGSGANYSFTVTPTADGDVNVSVAAESATAAGGAVNAASNELIVSYATNATVILSTISESIESNSFNVTAAFSKSVTGFALSDLSVTNGTASNLSGSGANYSFTITASQEGPVTVVIPSSSVSTLYNASNDESNTLSVTYATDATPTLTAVNAVEYAAFTQTISFNKEITGFVIGDISVTNATLSNFTQVSSLVYSFLVTPTADGTVSIQLPQGSVVAPYSKTNVASSQINISYYSPVSLTLSTASNSVSQAFSVTAAFSKSVTGFALGDISVTNGTASNLSGLGSSYTFTVTPSADGNVAVSVLSGSILGAGGETNTASNELIVAYATNATVVLSTASQSIESNSFSVSATFSKSVTGFALSDLSITNGTASNLSGSGANYSFTITASQEGAITVVIPSSSVSTLYNASNDESNTLSVTYSMPENLYIGATGSNWNTASNWSLNSVPKIAGDFARFNNATAHSVNLDADVALNKLQLDKGQQTISSSSSKKITFDGSNEQVIVNYAAATSSNAPTISAGVILTDNLSFSGGPIKISGAITGTGATINNRSTTLDLLSASNSFASAIINNYKTLHAASGALGGSPTINLNASENNVEFVATLASGAVNFNCPEGREIALSSYNKPTTFSAPVTFTGTIDGTLKMFHYNNPNNVNLSAASFSNVTFGNNSKIIVDGNGTNGTIALPLNLNGNVKIEVGKKSAGSSTNIVNVAFPSSQTVINNPIEFYGSPDAGCTTYLGLNGANSILNGNVVLDAGGNAASGTKFYFTTSSATAMTINGNISGTSHANTSGVTLFVTNALNLNGANTFTNPITIQGSGIVLRVNGSISSNVTVNSSNSLTINGTNAGNVTLAGFLAGNGTNTGNVTTSGSSSRIYTYNNITPIVSSRVNDILTVNGNLTSTSSFAFYPYTNTTEGPNKVSKLRVNGNVNVTNGITITFNMIANPGAGSYRVMEYTGTWTGSPTFAVTGTGWTTGVTVNHDPVAKTITLVKV